MDVLYLLIPLSVVLALLVAGVLWLAVRSGQFDDMEGPAFKVLLDDDSPRQKATDDERDVSDSKA